MIAQEDTLDVLIKKVIETLDRFFYKIFQFSNILLCVVFFALAYILIRNAEMLEHQDENIKIKLDKVHWKVEYGSLVLVLLSVGFLFNVIPIFLYFILKILPYSPFLSIIHYLYKIPSFSLYYTSAILAFFSFFCSIIGLYYAIFHKIITEAKTRGFTVFILFMGISIFFGIPLMLELIVKQGIKLIV